MDTRTDLLRSFISWVNDNEMYLSGYVPDSLLGVDMLNPLHEDDYDKVIKDFLASYNEDKNNVG